MALKKSFFDLNNDLFLIVNRKGVVKDANKSFLQNLGFDENELKGQNFFRFIHEDDMLPAKMFFGSLESELGTMQQLLRLKNMEGNYVPFNFILKYRTKKKFMLQAVDFATFNQTESDRFINEHVLFLILDLVPYPVFVKNSRSEYILLNQAQASLFGMSVDQMLGKRDDELVKDNDELVTVRESDNLVLETLQKVTLAEQYFTTPNGRKYVLQTTKVPFINAVTSEKNILGISVDYTERKIAEDELMKTNFELDSFVYRASHDLKAPLRSVMGLVDLLKMDKTEENQEMCISRIESSIFRLDQFIKELTNYSRNARLEISRQLVDLEESVYLILDNLKYLDPNRRISVEVKIESQYPFYSDIHRLQVILQNLISNAIKYQNPKNDSPFIKIEGVISKEIALLKIKDNGIGINEKYQEDVFKMFYRATELSEGSGLGLYIAKQSAEKLGGGITFTSSEDSGTTFELVFKNLV